MNSISELNRRRVPNIKINNEMEKYKNMPLFKDNLDKANETLMEVGIPKFRKQPH